MAQGMPPPPKSAGVAAATSSGGRGANSSVKLSEVFLFPIHSSNIRLSRARSLVWLGRRPHTAKVPGSSPGGPTIEPGMYVLRRFCTGLNNFPTLGLCISAVALPALLASRVNRDFAYEGVHHIFLKKTLSYIQALVEQLNCASPFIGCRRTAHS